jgi:hypothetical protein
MAANGKILSVGGGSANGVFPVLAILKEVIKMKC